MIAKAYADGTRLVDSMTVRDLSLKDKEPPTSRKKPLKLVKNDKNRRHQGKSSFDKGSCNIQYWELEVEQELFRRLQRNLFEKNKKLHSSKFNYLANSVGFIKIG